jgi:hypothetical protein
MNKLKVQINNAFKIGNKQVEEAETSKSMAGSCAK